MDQTAYFEQMRQKRRTEILTAAKTMITKQGLNAFTFQQLAKTLDISTVTLYKYFKNSEDIMLAMKQQILTDDSLFGQLIPEEGDLVDRFFQAIRNLFSLIMKRRKEFTLLCLIDIYMRNEKPPQTTFFESHCMKEFRNRLFALLTAAKKEGHLQAEVETEAAFAFIERLNYALLQHIALMEDGAFKSSRDELEKQVESLMVMHAQFLMRGR